MPPVGRPRPDDAAYTALASWLETEIDRAAAANPNPGRTETFHRLNRIEYRNVIRDLLSLDVDVAALLPPDDTFEAGFDNNAATLSISPVQLDRYLSAAGRISRLAVGVPPNGPVIDTYRVPLNLVQDDRVSDELPFGSRGGVAIDHYFPVDGEYTVKVKLQENYNDYLRGMGTRQRLDVRLDGERVKQFSVGGDAPGRAAPVSFGGNILGDPEWEWYMHSADHGLEVRFKAKAGPRVVAVAFERRAQESEGIVQPRQTSYALAINEWYDGYAAVDNVQIAGPHTVAGPGDTPSRRAIFVCAPTRSADEAACARKILANLARRAYRRATTEKDVETLLAFYRSRRGEGGNFEAGIQLAVERLLVDPEFLARIERDPPNTAAGAAYRVNDLELASRLSFFLWNSIPDDELLDLAIRRKLREPLVLEQQTRRMLADARSSTLVENFVGQWLTLRNLKDVLPDPDGFPDFDENLREAFQRETELFVESTLREDRSVVDLVGANYTFVNERLAKHYQIPNVYGRRFRRVTFGKDDPRGGLLGQGSVLTVTSYAHRTSPVLRGKWLLQNVLGTPPPAPPPNVPALPERGEGGRPASVRERLEQHRRNPVCASCHAAMDPMGFALENFDAIGTWRATAEGGTPLDVSGLMPSGVKFEGPVGLRELFLSQREIFVGTFAEKLLAYALGRPVEYYDRPAIRKILRETAPVGHTWSSVILGIVKSAAFQMRRARPENTVTAAGG